MATFEQRDSGWWQAKVRRRGFNQSHTFQKKSDAEKWARDVENQIDRGIFIPREEAEQTSLAEALERYQREVTPTKKGAYQENSLIKAWLRAPLSSRMLANLRSVDFASWRDAALAEGLSQQTVRHKLNLISSVFKTANMEWGIHVTNPIANIRKPPVAKSRDRRLSPEEETRLFDAIDSAGAKDKDGNDLSNRWVKPVVQIALETGMRLSELLSLEWKHVDIRRRIAHLPDTKNGSSRTVPLSSAAASVLNALPRSVSGKVFDTSESALKQAWQKAVRRARKVYETEIMTAAGWTPRQIRGTDPVPARQKDKIVRQLAADDTLVDLHFHDLRHEATSRLFEKGLDIMEVASITGHKTLQMLKRYTHLKAENLARKLG